MSEVGRPPKKDAYGLPAISLDGGKPEATDRGAARAPILIGGVVTGKTFQTDAVNPRIVIDSVRLAAYNTAGQRTVNLDIATGQMDFLTDTGISANVRFVNAAGTVLADISYTTTFSGLFIQGIASPIVMSFMTTANNFAVYPQSRIVLSGSSAAMHSGNSAAIFASATVTPAGVLNIAASDGTRNASINLLTALAAQSDISVGEATARLRFFTNVAATYVDYINGLLVFNNNKFTAHSGGGMGAVVGHRANTVTAGNAWGNGVNWRHVRSDANGAAVVPGSVTFGGAPSVNTNANTPQIRFISASGGMFTVNGTAAGITDYFNTLVVN